MEALSSLSSVPINCSPSPRSLSLPFCSISCIGSLRNNALTSRLPQIRRSSSPGRRAVIVMRNNAAVGYASALAEAASALNVLEAVNTDAEKLGRLLEDKQLYDFLINPVAKEEDKKAVLKSLAADAQFHSYTLNLLALLVEKKRTILLKDVVKEFEKIYNEMTDTQVAIVTSAVKIDTTQLALIAKKIQSLSGAKNVRMKNVIDSSVIAGFVVRYGKDGSRVIDMSVKGQLDRISQLIDYSEQKVGAF